MRFVIAIFLTLFIGVVGFQIHRLYTQRADLEVRATKLATDIQSLEDKNGKLSSDISYFSDARNLVKAAQSVLNYKKPGEELMIIIPPKPRDISQ